MSLPDRIAALLESFDVAKLEPFLREADELYADDVRFRDPMQAVTGRAAFREVNVGLAKNARSIRFVVHDVTGDDARFYLSWTMTMKPKLGPELALEGVSRMIGRDGRVIEHVDYWDLAELFATPIGGRKLVHALMRPFTGR